MNGAITEPEATEILRLETRSEEQSKRLDEYYNQRKFEYGVDRFWSKHAQDVDLSKVPDNQVDFFPTDTKERRQRSDAFESWMIDDDPRPYLDSIGSDLDIESENDRLQNYLKVSAWIGNVGDLDANKVRDNYDALKARLAPMLGIDATDDVSFLEGIRTAHKKQRDSRQLLVGDYQEQSDDADELRGLEESLSKLKDQKKGLQEQMFAAGADATSASGVEKLQLEEEKTREQISALKNKPYGLAGHMYKAVNEGEHISRAFAEWTKAAKKHPGYDPKDGFKYYAIARDAYAEELSRHQRIDVLAPKVFRELRKHMGEEAGEADPDALVDMLAGMAEADVALLYEKIGKIAAKKVDDPKTVTQKSGETVFRQWRRLADGMGGVIMQQYIAAHRETFPEDADRMEARRTVGHVMQRVAEGVVDPVKRSTLGERFWFGNLDVAASMSTYAVPYAGMAVNAAAFYNDSREKLLERGVDPGTATKTALVTSAFQTGIDRIQFGLAKPPMRRLSRLEKIRDQAKLFGTIWVGESVAEVVQDPIGPWAIEKTLESIGYDLKNPDSFMDVFNEAVTEFPDVAMSMVVPALMGSGNITRAQILGDIRKDRLFHWKLRAMGYDAGQIEEIVGSDNFLSAMQKYFKERGAPDPEAIAKLREENINIPNEGQRDLVRSEKLPWLSRTADGTWRLHEPGTNLNEFILESEDSDEIQSAKRYWMEERDITIRDTLRDELEYLETLLPKGRALKTVQSTEQPVAAEIEDEAVVFERERFRAREMGEQPDFEKAMGNLILGENVTEFVDKVAVTTVKLHANAFSQTVFEEVAEGHASVMIEEGRAGQMEGWLRDNGFADLLPETEVSTNDLKEAWSSAVVTYALARRKELKAKGVDITGVAGETKSVLRNYVTFFKQVLSRARQVMRMRREGSLDKDFEEVLAEQVGLDLQLREDRETVREAVMSARDVAQALQGGKAMQANLAKQGMSPESQAFLFGDKDNMPDAPTFSMVGPDFEKLIGDIFNPLLKNPAAKLKIMQEGKRRATIGVRKWQQAMKFVKSDADAARKSTGQALRTYNSVLMSLPSEIRGQVGIPVRVADVVRDETKLKELGKKFRKMEKVVERHLVKDLRAKIEAIGKKAEPKGPTKGVIGATPHQIIDAINEAKAMDTEEAMERAEQEMTLSREAENPDDMDKHADLSTAYSLFADYHNPKNPSTRLNAAYEFIEQVYREGRQNWTAKQATRRREREKIIVALAKAFDSPISPDSSDKYAEKRSSAFKDSIRAWGSKMASPINILDEIGRFAPEIADQVLKEKRQAWNDFEDREWDKWDLIENIVAEIYGIKTNVNPRVSGVMFDLSKPELNPKVTRATTKTIHGKVSKDHAQAITDGDVSFIDKEGLVHEFGKEEVEAIREAWENYLELPEHVQEARFGTNLTYEYQINVGKRKTIGDYSQLEKLKEWLAYNQIDVQPNYQRSGFDDQWFDELTESLDPKVLAIGEKLLEELERTTTELNETHSDVYGIALSLVDSYFPVVYDNNKDNTEDYSVDGVETLKGPRKGVWSIPRISHGLEPQRRNVMSVFHGNRQDVNHFLTHIRYIQKWHRIFRDPRVRRMIEIKLGKNVAARVQEDLENAENYGRAQLRGNFAMGKVMMKLRQALAMGVLGWNLRTILLNSSNMLAVTYAHAANKLAKEIPDITKDDIKKVLGSPTLKRRLKHGAGQEMLWALEQSMSGRTGPATMRRAGRPGMQAINFFDVYSHVPAVAAYRIEKKAYLASNPGASEEVAEEHALDKIDDIVTRFGQPNSYLNRSFFETRFKDTPAVFMFMFITESRKHGAIQALAIRKLLKGKKGRMSEGMALQQLFFGSFMYPLMTRFWQALFEEDEGDEEGFVDRFTNPKNLALEFMNTYIRGIPIAGEAMNTLVATLVDERAWDRAQNPFFAYARTGKEMADLIERLSDGDAMFGDFVDTLQAMGRTFPELSFIGQLGNFYEQIVKAWENTFKR